MNNFNYFFNPAQLICLSALTGLEFKSEVYNRQNCAHVFHKIPIRKNFTNHSQYNCFSEYLQVTTSIITKLKASGLQFHSYYSFINYYIFSAFLISSLAPGQLLGQTIRYSNILYRPIRCQANLGSVISNHKIDGRQPIP